MPLTLQKLTSQEKVNNMEEGTKLIYSGKEGGEAWCGVGFLLNSKAAEAFIASHPMSAWIISIWLSCQGMKATFIQVYTLTADSSDDEINSFYNDPQTTLNSIPKRNMLSFWETSMLRSVFTSPYRKIPWANLALAIWMNVVRDFYSSASQMSYLLQSQFFHTNHQGNGLGIIPMGCIGYDWLHNW